MRKFSLIVLLLLGTFGLCQQTSLPGKKKQVTSPKGGIQSKTIGNPQQTYNLVNTLQHDTCLNRKFSIVFYVVLDSSFLPGVAVPTAIAQFMDTLNDRFKKICVGFQNCSTVYIPNHSYNDWNRVALDSMVTQQWNTPQTINIYLVDSIKQNFPYEATGYSYRPPATMNTPTKDVIVIEKWTLLVNNCIVPMHHIGHYFGLIHTHDEINPSLVATPPPPPGVLSKEFADGSNCLIHGDGLCDTEADPAGASQVDGKGDYYLKPHDNYMSFGSNSCRFTQMQYNRMAYIMITTRKYLH